jgi:hypothetical protein
MSAYAGEADSQGTSPECPLMTDAVEKGLVMIDTA